MFPGSSNSSKVALWAMSLYAVIAGVFAVVTNLALDDLFEDRPSGLWAQIAVDVIFVLITSLIIYWLVNRELQRRANVEQELREKANLLTKAASIAHMATWHWDYATDKLTWSEEMYGLYGVSKAEFDGDPDGMVRRTVHPDDLQRVLEFNDLVRAHRKPLSGEYRVVWPNGEIRTLFGDGANILGKDGKPVALIGIIQDITDYKRTEANLHLRSAALEAAANAVVITDKDGTILWANPGFEKLSGYDSSSLLGNNIRLLNSLKYDAATYEVLWRTILAGNVWRGETINQRQDGSLYVEEQTITPVRDSDGVVTHFVAISQDVSVRHEAEKALRESEDRFRKLAERIPDIIYRFRLLPTPKLEYISPAITTITGYTPAELYARPEIFGEGVYPADRDLYAAAPQLPVVALRIYAKDGHLVWLEQRHVAEFNEAGEVVAVDGVARDITDRVQRQNELEAMARMSKVLTKASSRAAMLPLVLDEIQALMGVTNASIITRDPNTNDLVAELGRGEYASKIVGTHLPRNGTVSSQVWESGVPYVSEDLQNDPNFKWLAEQPATIWSAVCVPMQVENEAIGVLWVYHDAKFTAQDVQLLMTVANITATALQRVTLHEQTQNRTRQLAVLNEAGNALAETLDLPTVLRRVADSAQNLLSNVSGLLISLYETDSKLIKLAYGLRHQVVVDTSVNAPRHFDPDGLEAVSVVIRTGQPLIVNDLTGAGLATEAGQAKSMMVVPLKAKGAVVGLLEVESEQAGRFGPTEAELLSLVGAPAAVAIQNARLFAENMERLETITALYVSAQKLSFDRDLERMTQDVVRTCVESYGAKAVWLARVESSRSLQMLAYHPAQSTPLAQLEERWNEATAGYRNPARQAIDSTYPVVIHDLQADTDFEPWLDLAYAHELRSCIAFPLISRDEPVGVLCLFSDTVGFFTPRRQSFFQAYAHHVAVALENSRLIAETGRRLQQLQSLRAIDAAITGSLDLRLNLKIILDQVITQLGSDAADLLILNKNTLGLDYAAGRGFLSNARQSMRLLVGQGYAGQVVLTRRALSIPVLAGQPPSEETGVFATEGFASYYGMPLIAKGQVTGVLEIFHRRPFVPDAEWLEFFKSLTEQSAIAIDNASLFAGLQRTNLELALAYDATIEGLSRVMDMRDKEAEGHTQRVTELALSLGERLGLSGEALMHLRRGGLLHDIGKLSVPDQVLLKTEPLTPVEWDQLKKHPNYAYQMLSSIAYLKPALDVPYCHHERWDGSGYPRGLKGEQIPLAARIFAVVDVWDALTSTKPYREAWSAEKAREHLRSLAGVSFDPRVVEAFLELNIVPGA